MRAVLYARVSSKVQADEGYSLEDQLRTLRKWAADNGHEVVEEVTDAQSGASLVCPGLARVEELVKVGGVDMVVTQYQDRIARDPAIADFLEIRYEQHGTKLRALNEPEDDSPTGALTKGILRQLAKFDRAMIIERTRNGRFARARKGEVIGSGSPPYGFVYNHDRTNFVPNPETMPIVRRIFELAAAGETLHSITLRFKDEGIPTPGGGTRWHVPSIRRMILNDVYAGIWWYGQNRVKLTPDGDNKRTWEKIDRDEWVAIPVPDSGIPHDLIHAARARVQNPIRARRERVNDKPTKFYELRGMVRCACCGLRVSFYSTGSGHRYYRCQNLRKYRKAEFPDGASGTADKLEREVMRRVDSLLSSPDLMRQQLDTAIEDASNPDQDALGWLRVMQECDRKRAAYQDQQAMGLMTLDELAAKLAEINETRTTAQTHHDRLQRGINRADELRATRNELLAAYKDGLLYDGLLYFDPEIRRELYTAMKLEATVNKAGDVRINCDLNQQVIKMSRAVEEWSRGQYPSSWNSDKVMAEVVS